MASGRSGREVNPAITEEHLPLSACGLITVRVFARENFEALRWGNSRSASRPRTTTHSDTRLASICRA
jgi:hypothetical protein